MFNRGARRLPIFGDDDDREYFLGLIGRVAPAPIVHAYALMGNHYHLLIEADVPELSAMMKRIGENYTRRFNKKYGFDGPLFRSRFRSKPIASSPYLRHPVRYIHRNPIVDGLGDWTYVWSSHAAYLGVSARPSWLSTRLLAEFGDRQPYREIVQAGETNVVRRGAAADGVRVGSPASVEFALGIASPEEIEVVAAGGRGLRNDLRVVAALLGSETTNWSSERLAARYGYSFDSSLRTAVARARRRLTSDPELASLVASARARLERPAA